MLNIIIIIVLIFLGLGFWAGWLEPRKCKTLRYGVPIPNLKEPLKVVVIGDIQPNTYHWPAKRLHELFAQLQKEHEPDLVLWLGDYFNAPTDASKTMVDRNPWIKPWLYARLPDMEAIAGSMAELRGRLGDVAVLGNHDWAWSGEQTTQALEDQGIKVLRDDVLEVPLNDGSPPLQIVGYEDISSSFKIAFSKVHAALNADSPQIALSHSPDAFPDGKGGPPLMLSGHTHGGQICIPFIGPIVLPVHHREYHRGWFEADGRRLFVTSGLGTSLPPLRFLVPPEVVILDLEPLPSQEGE